MAAAHDNVELSALKPREEDDEKYPSAVWRNTSGRHLWVSHLLRSLYDILKWILKILIPSFLSPGYDLKFRNFEPGSTQWLDGLRGVASFIVFISHFIIAYIPEAHYSWDPVRHPNLLFLPIFHVCYNGTAMVRIFFVVSGFALTNSAVKLLRKKGHHKALLTSIASSILRRYLRLYLPCFGSYVLVHFMRGCGAMDWYEYHHKKNRHDLAAVQSKSLPHKSRNGILGQIPIMLNEFWRFAVRHTLFDKQYDFKTNPFLWTIPIEFHGSILLFLLVAGLSQVRRTIRVYIILPLLCTFYMANKSPNNPIFIFGYILAEIHVAMNYPDILPISISTPSNHKVQKAKTILLYMMVVIALWLLSFPNRDGDKSFTFVTLCKVFFKGYNYKELRSAVQNYGAMILCFAMIYLPRLQRLFSTRPCQYLGRISFSLYLMHGLMLRTVGHRIILGLWDRYPREAHTERIFIAVTAFTFVLLPITICASDLFWRACEAPATTFVRRLEGLIIVQEEKPLEGQPRTQS